MMSSLTIVLALLPVLQAIIPTSGENDNVISLSRHLSSRLGNAAVPVSKRLFSKRSTSSPTSVGQGRSICSTTASEPARRDLLVPTTKVYGGSGHDKDETSNGIGGIDWDRNTGRAVNDNGIEHGKTETTDKEEGNEIEEEAESQVLISVDDDLCPANNCEIKGVNTSVFPLPTLPRQEVIGKIDELPQQQQQLQRQQQNRMQLQHQQQRQHQMQSQQERKQELQQQEHQQQEQEQQLQEQPQQLQEKQQQEQLQGQQQGDKKRSRNQGQRQTSSFRGDLGKRTSFGYFRGDLGKRPLLNSFRGDLGKNFRGDLGKRRSLSSFRGDLGKRLSASNFWEDLGKRTLPNFQERLKMPPVPGDTSSSSVSDTVPSSLPPVLTMPDSDHLEVPNVFRVEEEAEAAPARKRTLYRSFRRDPGSRSVISSFRGDLGKRSSDVIASMTMDGKVRE